MLTVILCAIVFIGTYALLVTIRDMVAHREEIRNAPGRLPLQLLNSFVIYFLAAFGISDFALCTVIYSKTGWSTTRDLPGTLNTQGLVALMIMSLTYITSIEIALPTLLLFFCTQTIGSYLGPRASMRLRLSTLKYAMSAGLLMAGLFILASKLGWIAGVGTATALHGWKLAALGLLGLALGVFKAMGIGSYPLTMAFVYISGLSPLVTYPLMMGASALSNPVAVLQFVKLGTYSRRIALCSFTAGAAGALIAVSAVKNMNVASLQWVVLLVVLFASFDMFRTARKQRRMETLEQTEEIKPV